MSKVSAGLLMFRQINSKIEVFIAHPGGPFWKNKDEGAWSIPKGLIDAGENPLDAAKREFEEETSLNSDKLKSGSYFYLGEIQLKSGKTVKAWAFETYREETPKIKSNTFEMEWPPHSGQKQHFPEIDRAEFFELETAAKKLNPAQKEFLERLSRNN